MLSDDSMFLSHYDFMYENITDVCVMQQYTIFIHNGRRPVS